MSYFYGPVFSRRLGYSLGLDLSPRKICTFDCIYCQVGKTTTKTTKRFSFVDLKKMEDELKKVIRRKLKIDYITMSGSGEPTLHKDLDKIISSLKKVTSNKIPICLITNSSLLYRKKVRLELKEADLIIPSLDGATSGVFAKINKQDSKVGFQKVIQGLVALRKEFKGKIWLEIMLIKGINDSALQAQAFKKIIQKIKPDKVQLNLPVRPSRLKVNLPELKKVKMFKRILGKSAKIVANFPNQETGDLNFLKKRPILF